MAETKLETIIRERMVHREDVNEYEKDGWKKSHNMGKESCIITKTEKVEVPIVKTRIEEIDEQIKKLEDEKKALKKADK